MKHHNALTDGLKQAAEMERRLAHLYHTIEHDSRNERRRHALDWLHNLHARNVEQLDKRREELQRLAGEGWFGEFVESLGEAISNVIAGLPRDFIEGNTHPPLDTMQRMERELIEYYEKVRAIADDDTARLIDSMIGESRQAIQTLTTLDV